MNYRLSHLILISLSGFAPLLAPAAGEPAVAAPATPSVDAAKPARPDIVGKVVDTAGNPVTGAIVFVDIAWPKVGHGVLCPSCYADCAKQAVTDDSGEFHIDDLSPELGFRLLVAAPGFGAATVDVGNPGANPVTLKLKPERGGETSDKRATGRVLSSEGLPVAGATVSVSGVTTGNSTQYVSDADITGTVVTDADGRFTVRSVKSFDSVNVKVYARGHARALAQLRSGDTETEVRAKRGAALSGVLTKNGEPVAGAVMGVVTTDRTPDNFYLTTIATDKAGRFEFTQLPPDRAYSLYATADSLKGRGAVKPVVVRVGADESETKFGEMSVISGYTVAGRVKLTDGKPFPAHTRLMLSRADCWDQSIVELSPDGAFRFVDVAPGEIVLSLGLHGYRPTIRNSLNLSFACAGRVSVDKTDLLLEFEPGEMGDRNEMELQMPLRGAEPVLPKELPAQDNSALKSDVAERKKRTEEYLAEIATARPWRFAGKIIDDSNPPKPVVGAKVSLDFVSVGDAKEARMALDEGSPLKGKIATTNSAGVFDFGIIPANTELQCAVVVKGFGGVIMGKSEKEIWGDTGLSFDEQSNLTLRLRSVKASADKSVSENGVVLSGVITDVTGDPVSGASAYASMLMKNGVRVSRDGLSLDGSVTDESGHFELRVAADFDTAWVQVSAPGFVPTVFKNIKPGANAEALKLLRGCRVTGRLVKDGAPLVGIRMQILGSSIGERRYAVTDADGRFAFEHLAPAMDYFVFPKLESIVQIGACKVVRVGSIRDNETFDAGTLTVTPGIRLAGRVIASDGKLPARIEAVLHRPSEGADYIHDPVVVLCDEDGRFEFPHVLPGPLTLGFSAEGTRLSRRTSNSGNWLKGRLDKDKTDLVIELEPVSAEARNTIAWPELHGAETASK